MGSIIAIASHKGGVGKTTTALNLGYALSRFRGGVLVVDADPQGSLAVASNLRARTGRGLVHLLRQECSVADVVIPSRDGSMSIVSLGTSSPDDTLFIEEQARNGVLGETIAMLSGSHAYTIVDAPSGVGGLTTALLNASSSVILTVLPKALTLRTLPAFLRTIQYVRKGGNSRLRIEGVVVTMFDATSASDQDALDQIKRSFPEDVFFHTVIPLHPLFEEATVRSVPVVMLPGGQRVARSYFELALEVRDRNLLRETGDAEAAGLF